MFIVAQVMSSSEWLSSVARSELGSDLDCNVINSRSELGSDLDCYELKIVTCCPYSTQQHHNFSQLNNVYELTNQLRNVAELSNFSFLSH